MIALLSIIFTACLFAEEPLSWSYSTGIHERHEFYQNNEIISKPQNAWQTLFSVSYVDGNLAKVKDCVFYKVPGQENGILKIKTTSFGEKCDDLQLAAGDREVKNIKSLQFSVDREGASIDYSLVNFKPEKWTARLPSKSEVELKLNTPSVDFKSSRLIMLAPEARIKVSYPEPLKENSLCHDINEDCQEVSSSVCSQCPEGWFEVPNGCMSGPKYCGVLKCGQKNQPACRRGMRWQRKEIPFDCRVDSSFAYCADGLSVTCDGRKAFCR